jgi:pimeloyl-ACP methyl ester carboxylesterase
MNLAACFSRIAFVVIASFLLLACERLAQDFLDAQTPNTTPTELVPATPDAQARSIIVFVHGILGDTKKTWLRANDANSGFVRILNTHEMTKGKYDLLLFGFPSEALKSGSFTVSEAAKLLADTLESRKVVDKYDEIYFVAHSMGGLVTLEMLTMYPSKTANIILKVPAVVTLSTPFGGAQQIIDIANHVVNNQALLNMVGADQGNDYLKALTQRWLKVQSHSQWAPKVYCAYETVDFPGLGRKIVTYSQATSLCSDVIPIPENHVGVAKPVNDNHGSFTLLLRALEADLPGVARVKVRRVSDFSGSTCWPDGRCDLSEVITDEYAFSQHIKKYTARAEVNQDMELKLHDLNQNAAEIAPSRSCKNQVNCGAESAEIYEWPESISVVGRVARIKWVWKSKKPKMIEGPSFRGRTPLESIHFTVLLPRSTRAIRAESIPANVCATQFDDQGTRVEAQCQHPELQTLGKLLPDGVQLKLTLDR